MLDLDDQRLHTMVLEIENHGRTSAELHAAAMFPEVFGLLPKEDFEKFFNGKRFRGVWTKQLQIPKAGSVMARKEEARTSRRLGSQPKRTLTDLRLLRAKSMTNLTLAEHAAVRAADVRGSDQARNRWEELHALRFLNSSLAYAYRDTNLAIRHATKSAFLPALKLRLGGSRDGRCHIPIRRRQRRGMEYISTTTFTCRRTSV